MEPSIPPATETPASTPALSLPTPAPVPLTLPTPPQPPQQTPPTQPQTPQQPPQQTTQTGGRPPGTAGRTQLKPDDLVRIQTLSRDARMGPSEIRRVTGYSIHQIKYALKKKTPTVGKRSGRPRKDGSVGGEGGGEKRVRRRAGAAASGSRTKGDPVVVVDDDDDENGEEDDGEGESADMGIGDSELEQLRSAIGEPEE